ncbi:MAG: hypothetical protein ACKO5K_09800 [Armatimonadota bacterium]
MKNREARLWTEGTLRSAGWLATTIGFLLCGWNQWWAVGPFAAGFALAIGLLLGHAWAIPRVVVPPGMQKKRPAATPKTAILAIALVKYPMVATLIWWIVRHWEPRAVAAFAGGFVCLQAVIGLRAIGKAWSESQAPSHRMRAATDD